MGLYPANLLPDILYIQVGKGGSGGTPVAVASGLAGGSSTLSYVSIEPSTSVTNLLLSNANTISTGGGGGTTAGGGTGGVTSAVFVQSNSILSYLGVLNTIAGVSGIAGSFGGGGGSNSDGLGPVSRGQGGAGMSAAGAYFNGGSNVATAFIPLIRGGLAGGNNGSNGFTSLPSPNMNKLPMFFLGGAGGGSGVIGGDGGNGSFGSGGGGGAAGSTLGGRGGRGGDGLVIITCF